MQKSITIQLSGNRHISFTAKNGRVQVIAAGFITGREMADAKKQAIQRLADEQQSPIHDGNTTWTPRADPARPPGCRYNTRLLQTGGKKAHIRHTLGTQNAAKQINERVNYE